MSVNKINKKYTLGAKIDGKVTVCKLNEIIDDLNTATGGNQSITALAGGGQTGATALIIGFNLVATATTADSVKLPALAVICALPCGGCTGHCSDPCGCGDDAATGHAPVVVKNSGPGDLAIFPALGEAINGGTVNASITLASGNSIEISDVNCTGWQTYSTSSSTPSAGGGSSLSAQYSQIGSQPGTIAAQQPITFTTANLTDASITTVVSAGPVGAGTGTIFTLATAGRYIVSYQANPLSGPADAGIVIYKGASIAAMLAVPYTMIGTLATTDMSNTVILSVAAGDKVSLNAAAGNTAAVQFGPNSSTTNAASTTISFVRLA